jgi:hypothetical protein
LVVVANALRLGALLSKAPVTTEAGIAAIPVGNLHG